MNKLKYVAVNQPSNVDKKSKEDEQEVLLCNYVDVYKNEFIDDSIHYMKATATNIQIEKFILEKGDVLATKDSEDPSDIAVPALVTKDFENVVCGYHLTMIKSIKEKLVGSFLFRFLQSESCRFYFEVMANGITRYGLSTGSFNNLEVLTPSIDEQTQIAYFLDQKTAKLDQSITYKEQLISLLQEERAAIINEAVTKGIDPNAPMKDSGIEWIGEIPEHWEVSKMKFLSNMIIDGTHFTPKYMPSGIPFLRVTDIQSKEIDLGRIKYISKEEHVQLTKRCKPEKGDVLLSKNGTIGIIKIVDWDYEFSIFVSICLIKLNQRLTAKFFKYLFGSHIVDRQIKAKSKTTSVTNLHLDQIRELVSIVPTIKDQNKINKYLDKKTGEIDQEIQYTQEEIKLLKEYRQSLISEAVTGKIDVRDYELAQ